jgi:hypothetical protein
VPEILRPGKERRMLDLVAELAGRRVRGSRLPVERQDLGREPPALPSRPPPAAAGPARPTRSPPVRPEWPAAAQEALLEVWAEVAWRWCRAAGATGAEEDDGDPIDHPARTP